MKTIRTALLSVFHKDGIDDIARTLHDLGVTIYSTGGTQRHIEALDIPVEAVEDLTGYPSILCGRVKTLHPKVFGGILSRRHEDGDVQELDQFEIPEMDLVVIDLYPFEKTVAETDAEQDIIEKIDIGGISLIRAAAKNFRDVLCVAHRDQYGDLLDLLKEKKGATEVTDRRRFAARAFAVSSHYDTAIFRYFDRDEQLDDFRASHTESTVLRYGENPHQTARFHGPLNDMFDRLHGKALSYNNLVDIDAAVNVIAEFTDQPTFAILKHTNTCGLATRDSLHEAYLAALACDTVSAFGGILIANRPIDEPTAREIHKLFCEVVIAPGFDPRCPRGPARQEEPHPASPEDLRRPARSVQDGVERRAEPRPRCHSGIGRPASRRHQGATHRRADARPGLRRKGRQTPEEQRHRPGQGRAARGHGVWADQPRGRPETGH